MSEVTAESQSTQKHKNVILVDPDQLVIVKKESDPLYDERSGWKIDESMVKSIKVYGVIEPIVVRANGEKDGQTVYEVVAGRQRVVNCREANKQLKKEGSVAHRIACVVRNDEDKILMGVMIAENEGRRGDELITKAHKVARFLAAGQTESEAAVAFHCTTASIKNYLLLLECAKPVQTAVAKGELSADIAKKMAKMTKEDQIEALEELRKEGATKGKKAKKALAKASKGKVADDEWIGKKEIQRLFEALRTTAKQTKDEPEVGLTEAVKLLEYVLGKRKTQPFAIVEVSAPAEEEETPKAAKPKKAAAVGKTRVSAKPKKSGRKKAQETTVDGEPIMNGKAESAPVAEA
jgi:ParB/RepB/Spo0J family partition protein